MTIEVTSDEYRILEYLIEHKKILVDELATKSGFARAKVLFLLNELQKKQVVNVNDVISEQYKVTELGQEILEKGFPEEIIFKVLEEKQQIPMKELAQVTGLDKKGANAAIGRLRKSGYIKIEKGMLHLLKHELPSEITSLKQALKAINEGRKVEPSRLKSLKERGLVEITKKTGYEATIRSSKLDLKEFRIIEEVSDLTSEMITSGSWKSLRFKRYNFSAKPKRVQFGRPQPYKEFLEELKITLIGLGFQEMRGPIIETEFWNFDALFAPQDHPAREDSDILLLNTITHGKLPKEDYVKNVQLTHENGWETGSKGWRYQWDPIKAARLLLRPQGTAISARTLATVKPPAKYFSISRCYRPDVIDATHAIEFDQTEGIVVAEDLTFRDLLGILETFAIEVAGAEKVYFRPDFYPFTSPSVEMGAVHPTLGKIEFGGAGIFRPEVVKPFGIDVPVLAWGLGVGRLYMVKHNIKDIRELFTQDLGWLREEPIV